MYHIVASTRSLKFGLERYLMFPLLSPCGLGLDKDGSTITNNGVVCCSSLTTKPLLVSYIKETPFLPVCTERLANFFLKKNSGASSRSKRRLQF